jgi:two-component system KDP operon response regulator KdpE
LAIDDLEIDFGSRKVTARGGEVRLTPTEYDLLAHLAVNAGRVLTHRSLLQAVWGPEYGDETEYLWAYIRRLRRKIEPDPSNPQYILTQPGVGYTFIAPP